MDAISVTVVGNIGSLSQNIPLDQLPMQHYVSPLQSNTPPSHYI